ncbi:hypothetical protein R50072_27090 [Simiduia litorea]|uniref:sensor histidine kinase n=1 Tax=Simiduia litorea TaxID=1435348 RepID=UPI0036F37072
MHPIFSSNRTLLSVAILWSLLCCLIAFLLIKLDQQGHGALLITLQTLPLYGLLLFFGASNYYLCLRLPLANTPMPVLLVAQTLAAAITIGLWLVVALGWNWLLDQMSFQHAEAMYFDLLIANVLIALVLYVVWILVHYAYLGAKSEEHTSARSLEHQLLIKSIELEAIKLTVHPHFMYNSLTMVANLSLAAPEKIHDICVKMSDFLRYSVTYGKQDKVTFGDEITHIENYLSIEKERFGERLRVNMAIAPETLDKPTIALVLFPLIENCIKHGIGSQFEPGFISIAIEQRETLTHISISNSFDPSGIKPRSTKLGLSSLEKRIAYSFGPGAQMKVTKQPGQFMVELYLPALSQNPISLTGG